MSEVEVQEAVSEVEVQDGRCIRRECFLLLCSHLGSKDFS